MIVPIVGATVPFYARQVENALLEIDPGLVEAAKIRPGHARHHMARVPA